LKKKVKDYGYFKDKKPISLKMIPSSDEESSGGEGVHAGRGISVCAQTLSEAACLYLQSMKTFAIMFFILTIINMPILLVYKNSTEENDYLDLKKFFGYFTIGNLGQTDSRCDYTEIDLERIDRNLDVLNLECPKDQYIRGIKYFGFLYAQDN